MVRVVSTKIEERGGRSGGHRHGHVFSRFELGPPLLQRVHRVSTPHIPISSSIRLPCTTCIQHSNQKEIRSCIDLELVVIYSIATCRDVWLRSLLSKGLSGV